MGIKNIISRVIGPVYKPFRHQPAKQGLMFARYSEKLSIEKATIMYESRDGQSLTDSPLAIFKYLLENDQEKKYTHIWSYVDSVELKQIIKLYQAESNVIFVQRNSQNYLKWLAKAEYVINNATLQPFYMKKTGQTYINTWHGTPLKTMGYDMPGNPSGAKNVVRNFFQSSFLISPNQHTSKMYLDSYRLRGLYKGEVLEGGYPRIDSTLKPDKQGTFKLLGQFQKAIDQTKEILLYTPTWKGLDLTSARNDMAQVTAEMAYLRKIHGDKYNILVKVHPFIYKEAVKEVALKPYLIPDVIDTNELLGIVDVLITDYSSIFFDFLVTNKPILFYCWDADLYAEERGKYFNDEELPGPISYTVEELATALGDLPRIAKDYADNYQRCQEVFTPYEDGNVTKKYVDYIFEKKAQPELVIHKENTDKKKLLFYPGGMRNNGITSSFINLVSNIDFTKYEVTCLLDDPRLPEQVRNIEGIPKEVHLIFKFGSPNYTIKESYLDLYSHVKGLNRKFNRLFPERAYRREVTRLLGTLSFDTVIDFSGYSLYGTKLLLNVPAAKRVCFMHSDMLADSGRTVNGKKIHLINLNGLFSAYDKFDQLVSVSQSTKEVNLAKLKDYAPADKFTVVRNTINPQRILADNSQRENAETNQLVTKKMISPGKLVEAKTTYLMWNKNPGDQTAISKERPLNPAEEVLVIGKTEIAGRTYNKVMQGDIYLGWLDAREITLLADQIISQRTVTLIGMINTNGEDLLYSEPVGLVDSYVVSQANFLRNRYVEIDEVIETHTGSYFKVVINEQVLGWLPMTKFRASHRLNNPKGMLAKVSQPLLKKLIFSRDRKKYSLELRHLELRIIKTETVKAYGRLTNEKAVVWSTPHCNKIIGPAVTDFAVRPGQIVKISEKKVTMTGTSLLITNALNQSGWMNEPAIELLEAGKMELFAETNQSYIGRLLSSEVTFYHDWQLETKSPVALLPETVLTVIKECEMTNGQVVALVELPNKEQLWLDQSYLKADLSFGAFNVKGNYYPYPQTTEPVFVTMGRLSPEKQQLLLIRAFHEFYQTNQKGKLYIIGQGEEYLKLANEIKKLHLEEQVILTDQIANPFNFMAKCSIFCLTSIYEGQPMVLLEAMTLGLPIISTDIPACRYVLEGDRYGLLTETNDIAGIVKSMEELVSKKRRFAKFDYEKYNQEALGEFYQVV